LLAEAEGGGVDLARGKGRLPDMALDQEITHPLTAWGIAHDPPRVGQAIRFIELNFLLALADLLAV